LKSAIFTNFVENQEKLFVDRQTDRRMDRRHDTGFIRQTWRSRPKNKGIWLYK